jgi:cytochrome c2
MSSPRVKLTGALLVLAVVIGAGAAGANYWRERQKQKEHAVAMTRGDPDKAKSHLAYYGCAACHTIPGMRVPGGLAAPPLSGISKRLYLGGAVPNSPENLVRWIVNPKQFTSQTAMPVTGISEREARDVAAYLYRLQ